MVGITKLSSATNSDDETLAATPKAVKAAYDLAKTVSIDEVNKKFDKASVLQTTGDATDKVMSQKACDELLAKKSSGEPLKIGRLNVESPTGDTIFNLGGTNGSSGAEFAYVRNSKRTQVHDTNTKTTVLFPQKSGELALTSDFISNIRRGAKVQSPDTNEWGPNECPSGCTLTQVVHKAGTPYGVNCWYRPLQIFINGQWKTLAGDV